MERVTMRLILLIGLGFFLGGDLEGGATPRSPSGQSPNKRAEFIKKFDSNGNGKLDKSELEQARKAHQAELLKRYDKNGNGKIDDEERDAARKEFRRRKQQENHGDDEEQPKREEPKNENGNKERNTRHDQS